MKKIILIIIVLILLTGCNEIYNLSNFILPDDAEFLALVEELDTPYKIGQYMKKFDNQLKQNLNSNIYSINYF